MHTDKNMLERCSSPSLGRSLTRIFHSEVAKITQPQLGGEIEQTFREPITVGRVTPCAPRLQPAGAEFPRHRLGRAFREYSIPTSELSFNRPSPIANRQSPT